MKVILIGPGCMPIPPPAWGAVESIVWDYYENLKKKDIYVEIVNYSNPNQIIQECNKHNPDVIHIMYDDHIIVSPYLKCKKIFYTSHYAFITHPDFKNKYSGYFNGIFMKVIQNQQYITLNVISDDIANIYKKNGFNGTINILHNGAREDLFRYTTIPQYPNKSVYVAKIEYRKGQYKYQSLPNIDFVGHYHDSSFNTNNPNYIGSWNKPTLYNNLTDYANLILLSEGEADPLVIKEALMAGLGIVASECSVANLDRTLNFITIIPNNKLDDLEYINNEIILNRNISINKREEIRNYALQNFSWNNIINKYLSLI
jgi:glycosyltransferase involved in cell wall biosynthesis